MSDTGKKPRLGLPATAEGNLYLLLIGITVCTLTVLWIEHPVAPVETPGLKLEAQSVRAQMAKDAADSKKVPTGETAQKLDALCRNFNKAVMTTGVSAEYAEHMRQARILTLRELRDTMGASIHDTYRARAAELAIPGITGQMPAEEMRETVGPLIDQMFKFGMADGAHIVAPSFVIRTLAKRRWNLLFARDPTEGFSKIEQQAFFGWLALHSLQTSPGERLLALQRYEEAGGRKSDEARGTLFYLMDEGLRSSQTWKTLFDTTGNLRYRNYARAALESASN